MIRSYRQLRTIQSVYGICDRIARQSVQGIPRRQQSDLKFAYQAFLNVAGAAGVAYDPSGLIFGVTTNLKNATLLYDIRKPDAVSLLNALLLL